MNKVELEKESEEWVISNTEIYDDKFGLGCEEIPTPKEAYIAGAEPREKRIEELEKDIELLKNGETLKELQVEVFKLTKACNETQKLLDKQIEATYKLDKENTDLKEAVKHFNPCGQWDDDVHDCEFRHYAMEYGSELIKAKDIMERLVLLSNSSRSLLGDTWFDTLMEAEQFLKGNR